MSQPAIDYFSKGHRLRRWATRAALKARRAMYGRFAALIPFNQTTTVLDIGATPDQTLDDSNFFEALFPFPSQITVTSVEDASHLEQLYAGLRFVRTDGHSLPFPDGYFDVAFSAAVLEHVGNSENQRQFIAEMCRVSRRFFLTTPNRWFPIEVHTFLPLIHWLPRSLHQKVLRSLGKGFWARSDNLNLLSERDLLQLFGPEADVRIARHRVLGWTSNLMAWGMIRQPQLPARNKP